MCSALSRLQLPCVRFYLLVVLCVISLVLTGCPPTTVAVPDVVGHSQAVATTEITDEGLVVGTVTEAFSDTVPAGEVISQNPAALTDVESGSAMDLTVSKDAESITVPDVVGLLQNTAEAEIRASSFIVGIISEAFDSSAAHGEV